jgi:hypothetical protein
MPIEKTLLPRMFIGGPFRDMRRLYGLVRKRSKTLILATHMTMDVSSICLKT